MLFGKSNLNPNGWRAGHKQSSARQCMHLLKDKYSEMPGIGFYGSPPGSHTNGSNPVDVHDTATLELIEFANKISVEMWPDSPAAALKSDDDDGSVPGCSADLAAACGSFHADKTYGAPLHADKTLCDHSR